MRVLEAISAGLALTAAAIIFAVRRGSADTQLLFLSLICCVIIAVYQIVNFYLGSTLQKKITESRMKDDAFPDRRAGELTSGDETTFVTPHSVVENTTRHLDAVPRKAKQ